MKPIVLLRLSWKMILVGSIVSDDVEGRESCSRKADGEVEPARERVELSRWDVKRGGGTVLRPDATELC